MAPCNWDVDPMAVGVCADWAGYTTAEQATALELATWYLWAVTGRRFGPCPITVRPGQGGGSEVLYQDYAVTPGADGMGVPGGPGFSVDTNGVMALGGSLLKYYTDITTAPFNADKTGVVNASAAIQAAIDATPDGGTLFIPRGTYLVGPTPVGTSLSSIFTRANGQRINIVGEGFASVISVHASTASTIDVLRFEWTTSTRGMIFENFAVLPQSGNPGRHGIVFDFTGSDSAIVYQVIFQNLLIALDNAVGNGLYVKANVTSTSGGMAYSVIKECLLDGVRWENVGDNMMISHNTLIPSSPANPTVYVVNINGAKNFDFLHNVVAGLNTMLYHDGGVSSIIDGNWFETPSNLATGAPHNAMVDINGGVAQVRHVKIINNAFQSNIGTGLPNPIRINNSVSAFVQGNRLWTYGFPDYAAIVVTSAAQDTIIGANTYEEGNVLKYQESCIDNAGIRTVFLTEWKTSWDPVISFGGESTGITYGTKSGTAIRVGRVVTFSAVIPLGSKGSSTGILGIGILPWVAATDSPVNVELQTVTSGVGDTQVTAFVVGGFATLSIRKMVSGADTELTDADFTNGTTVRLNGCYITTA